MMVQASDRDGAILISKSHLALLPATAMVINYLGALYPKTESV